MLSETQWDLEVDVVCLGAEDAVLAAGLVAANAGFDTFLGIAEPTRGVTDMAAAVGYRGGDAQTTKHLSGFDYAFGRLARTQAFWPVRTVENVTPPRSRGREAIEPFFGAALEQWAHRCAAAPSGLVYNRVTKRQMTQLRSTTRGEKVEAAVVGSVGLSPGLPAFSLSTWLKDEAADAALMRDVDVRLTKLVFEDTAVAGARIETEDGVLAVRAKDNLIIGVGETRPERAHPLISATGPVTVDVCLVSKAASRFGELEIVTATGDDNRLLFVDSPEAELQLASGL